MSGISLEDLTPDQLLAATRKFKESDDLLAKLLTDPNTRKDALRLVKKAEPARIIPELEAEDLVKSQLDEMKAQNAELERRLRDKEIRDQIVTDRQRVQVKYSLTDADMIEVQKIMTDKDEPIPYWDRAAQYFLNSKRVAEPTPGSVEPPVFEMPEKDVWSSGVGDRAKLDKIALQQAYAAFNEIKSGKVAGS